MRMDDSRESQNIEDRRASGPRLGGKGRIGIGTIVLALVAMYFGIDPSVVLQMAEGPATYEQAPAGAPPANDPQARFVAKVLGETEDTWGAIFTQSLNRNYVPPKLVLFRGATPTACGTGQAAMGPFYCPGDSKVYIDLGFFDEMERRLNAPGDFAQAYVIAHEVGHHVQHLLGVSEQVDRLRQRNPAQANALSVRMELQADCFAGLWARRADQARNILESGDIEEGLNAASAIGDDTLQKKSQGYVVPDAFTHGSSAQRVRWFKRGLESGDLRQCDTFGAAQL
ncbi:KPN_02809 family neutral zinc metallopeptidase [Bordetella bronchiseptica]|uniref:Neutral zinc metallopeptidase n=2 Tax=Bordetella bronchiseptica TaxID=518 RepID=A0ABR4RA51_BORBO|nr:neutral zinc metallopeptidase [Bordetella bronchiseptica]SHR45907.1 putative metalloprotease [Mycobacteroides abscessus subsp. abscessus]KCV31689.1 putative neutral zinc metallopeptidase [Bordetella bronchiseptica 00-P-2796]KDC00019.1 putative neutral zinc metallopeptidase [Bordetella bronchiseptica E010]KDC01360.1 putative neutral zinc metallopeptidase [Bordetella bronchiseptica D993]KDC05594.1 putative neutral zinc metallopeptidase [Bordetella bronchiseptica E012]